MAKGNRGGKYNSMTSTLKERSITLQEERELSSNGWRTLESGQNVVKELGESVIKQGGEAFFTSYGTDSGNRRYELWYNEQNITSSVKLEKTNTGSYTYNGYTVNKTAGGRITNRTGWDVIKPDEGIRRHFDTLNEAKIWLGGR